MKRNIKKIIAIALACVVVIGGIGGGLIWYFQSQRNARPVEVEAVSNYTTMDWGSENYSYGMATSDYVQELYAETGKIIQEICVEEGQEVHAGDVLLRYDSTRMALDVEKANNDMQQLQHQLDVANQELARLRTLTPYVPAPEPEPEPEPELPERRAVLCESVDQVSQSFAGDGSPESPYRFLCTTYCQIDPGFLEELMGLDRREASGGQTEAGTEAGGTEESGTAQDHFTAVAPKYARFEVHQEDNENGPLLYGWAVNGADGFAFLEEEFPEITEPEEPAPVTDVPQEQYTKEELAQMITSKQEEITGLEYSQKQAQLSLEQAEKELENATVVSKIDGVVKTLVDTDSVIGTDKPFLVVSGENGFYIEGTLSEALISQISVGDYVEANNWESGMIYEAQIIEISQYPEESDNYYGGSGNPNSSNYRFTAVITETEGLSNGTYLDITIRVPGSEDDSFFLWKAYIRSQDGEKYVYKVGEDGRLQKQVVSTGRTLYGDYIEIKSGLTQEDLIAFPYGKNVKTGAPVKMPEGYEDPDNNVDDMTFEEMLPEGQPDEKE